VKGSAIVMAFVTAGEFSQLFFVSRTFDLLDLSADMVGFGFLVNLPAVT